MLSKYPQKKKTEKIDEGAYKKLYKRMNNWVIEELTCKTIFITAGMNTIKSKGFSITVQRQYKSTLFTYKYKRTPQRPPFHHPTTKKKSNKRKPGVQNSSIDYYFFAGLKSLN